MLLSGLSADAPPQGNEGSARAGQGRMLGLADWMESEHYGMKQLAAHPLLLHPAPPTPRSCSVGRRLVHISMSAQ